MLILSKQIMQNYIKAKQVYTMLIEPYHCKVIPCILQCT